MSSPPIFILRNNEKSVETMRQLLKKCGVEDLTVKYPRLLQIDVGVFFTYTRQDLMLFLNIGVDDDEIDEVSVLRLMAIVKTEQ